MFPTRMEEVPVLEVPVLEVPVLEVLSNFDLMKEICLLLDDETVKEIPLVSKNNPFLPIVTSVKFWLTKLSKIDLGFDFDDSGDINPLVLREVYLIAKEGLDKIGANYKDFTTQLGAIHIERDDVKYRKISAAIFEAYFYYFDESNKRIREGFLIDYEKYRLSEFRRIRDTNPYLFLIAFQFVLDEYGKRMKETLILRIYKELLVSAIRIGEIEVYEEVLDLCPDLTLEYKLSDLICKAIDVENNDEMLAYICTDERLKTTDDKCIIEIEDRNYYEILVSVLIERNLLHKGKYTLSYKDKAKEVKPSKKNGKNKNVHRKENDVLPYISNDRPSPKNDDNPCTIS